MAWASSFVIFFGMLETYSWYARGVFTVISSTQHIAGGGACTCKDARSALSPHSRATPQLAYHLCAHDLEPAQEVVVPGAAQRLQNQVLADLAQARSTAGGARPDTYAVCASFERFACSIFHLRTRRATSGSSALHARAHVCEQKHASWSRRP